MNGVRVALAAFGSGLLFGLGLIVSGMTDPAKVRGFLDLFGDWDPSLALVMGAALAVTAIGYRWIRRRAHPLLTERWHVPGSRVLDPPLVLGSAAFGIGWGLVGLCPGPAIVALGSGLTTVFVFVGAMIVAMTGFQAWADRTAKRESDGVDAADLDAASSVPPRALVVALLSIGTLALTGLPSGCSTPEAHLTPSSTPGVTMHSVDVSTRVHMRAMADELLELTALTSDRPAGGDRPARAQRLALGHLDRIEREARATSVRFMSDLLEDIEVARSFARRDPPNLVPANRLVQSCLACHRSLRR